MKRLLSALIISAIAASYAISAEASPLGGALSRQANLSLSITAPEGSGADNVIYLPSTSPAKLLNNDYGVILRSRDGWSFPGHDGGPAAADAGWKFIKVDLRTIRLQPTYFWSGNEVGLRADVLSADRMFVFTLKKHY